MHDIGRTQFEYPGEFQEFQPETSEYGQGELIGETVGEAFEMALQEGSFEAQEFETFESLESPLNESQEMELAAELLEITNEGELDRFLGKLIGSVTRGVGKITRSPLGRSLGGILKGIARKALPIAGTALGGIVGGPIGGALGGNLASMAGRTFGLELEGMSAEDAEFEVARRYVRLAAAAANNAASASPGSDPAITAEAATKAAAKRFAPGLVGSARRQGMGGQGTAGSASTRGTGASDVFGPTVAPSSRRKGIWIRRGRRILLLGV